jgi:hypothetical protein
MFHSQLFLRFRVAPERRQRALAAPIGLNGGINTYGYLNGDPVNAYDPYGLWRYPDYLKYGFNFVIFSAEGVTDRYGNSYIRYQLGSPKEILQTLLEGKVPWKTVFVFDVGYVNIKTVNGQGYDCVPEERYLRGAIQGTYLRNNPYTNFFITEYGTDRQGLGKGFRLTSDSPDDLAFQWPIPPSITGYCICGIH